MSSLFSQVKTYSNIILKTRKSIFCSKLSIITSILLTGAGYYSLISDYFQPYDPTNLSIISAMMDDDYKSINNTTISILENYNNGESKIKPTSDFYSFIPSRFFAMTVHIHGKLKPIQQNDIAENAPLIKYRYELTYRISISKPCLILFLLIELILCYGLIYFHFHTRSKHEVDFEDKVINTYYEMLSSPLDSTNLSEVEKLKMILKKFNAFQLVINNRYNGRCGIKINDEYDVQDLLHAILVLHFDDLQKESAAPFYLGSSSRIDFLIRDNGIAIEAKKTNKHLRDRMLADQIISDIHRYQSHPVCQHIIFFIYDPDHFIKNPVGLQNDINKIQSNITSHLIITPEI
ncbi:hypothetical protein N8S56_17550 [Enterobacter hormaechei subsp. hoffmannii]|uniref:PD-(D/E)XK nuclease domain-containing protein n=1 Tax=Enterobacter hormaechei TaxID=158836 RepID=UPI0018ED0BC3|nr:hypothetical protein [Enterobacter hormaechei]EKW1335523.1 hypothetical protein [Enterobacter hormaechei]MBJ6410009.1 hypothetical protein [Enterobacter hormaechei]MBJ6431144.1 hypothetical protein [Enterobacter hormaechei]MBK4535760.1 hypothetical protein [Enterobacter hormaechei]MCU2915323.1 hypothetical protein [Enterobacter hormaechei subsp. hoffmannii]